MLRIVPALLLSSALALPLAATEQRDVDIKEWPLPWADSRPRDPHPASATTVWFVAEKGNFLGTLNPQTGRFSRIELVDEPAPRNLIIGANGMLWYTASARGYLGRYDLRMRNIYRAQLVDAVTDPNALAFEAGERNIWFTARDSNIIGRFRLVNGITDVIRVPTPNALPEGIAMAPNAGPPWIALAGTNNLATIDPRTFGLTVRALPRASARPQRLAFTSDGRLWYVDATEGFLGVLTPGAQGVKEWPTPGGKTRRPQAIAVDARDRIWIMENSAKSSRLVGFDPKGERFFGTTAVPSGGGGISDMSYDRASGGLWFGTDANTIGYAKLN
jgi:virginiamycin B lyase